MIKVKADNNSTNSSKYFFFSAGTGPGYTDLDLVLVYDHLAFSEYQLGNIKRAAQYTQDLLQNGKSCVCVYVRVHVRACMPV